ncbi:MULTISPECIES: VOC family protein [Rhodomicrobium]|uniref:VOC family protein n=1 Tax=Rhodomicrobium TaxID=1068 RepID=UPI000B4BEEE0|nr:MULTISPECIES: VOC family protein [Rhodomicrobium]
MRAIGFNHLSVAATDLEASLRFYETVFGMERIPTYNFGFPAQWLRCGTLQLHLFQLKDALARYQHFALDVTDFHAVYEAAKELGALDETTFSNSINELPGGSVQMYLRDPGGNLLEVDWPDVTTLDRSRIPEMKKLADSFTQTGEALAASLYFDRSGFDPASYR